ncbi:MAG: glycoside hydrolase family 2 [Armatimonadota bacterium]|nr:MAG: glycoside hydrolase family 2 [Armatimonadota bacterium]
MTRIDLCGTWELSHRSHRTEHVGSLEETFGDDWEILPARVAGNVELALIEAGKLPDPFCGRNIFVLRPYEFEDWWYRRTFLAQSLEPGQRARLVFGGLDCFATIWLNGRNLGTTDNALIEHVFDVTDCLNADCDNTLVVRLASPVMSARGHCIEPSESGTLDSWEAIGVRKPPHCWGWDIMPRLVSAGLWRPVSLEILEPNHIASLYFCTRHASPDNAHLRVQWQVETDRVEPEGISVRFTGECGDSRFSRTVDARFTAGATGIDVPHPELWWPKGYGEPSLYTIRTELLLDGEVADVRTDRVGLRTIDLHRTETAGPDGDFRFVVNGVPVLVKGSNWVPADAFHSRDAERYAPLLALADDVGCNMLRCWGGNVYEDHAFFDLCDEKGIMVWQDFAFACSRYPQSLSFLARVRVEAESVIRKLRNHASLALWCGDNEIDCVYVGDGLDPAQNRISREALRRAVERCDPYRPYLPSSPYFSPQAGGDWDALPEQHLWGARNYYKSREYVETTAHFIGEIGYHGCPNVSSLRRFLSPDALWPWQDNEEWRVHATDPTPEPGGMAYRVELMAKQIAEMFDAVPDMLEDFALASQICQAEAKKFFVEMVRLRKWRRTGVLWWNLVDGWPQFSDAVVDYYLSKKLAYHYLRRVQQPMCLMVDEPDTWHVRLVMGNDSRVNAAGRYAVRDADSGAIVSQGEFESPANENCELARIPISRGQQAMWLIQWTANDVKGANHALVGGPPFALERYRAWLQAIAGLDGNFDADQVGR